MASTPLAEPGAARAAASAAAFGAGLLPHTGTGNTVFSPASIAAALHMALLGARGETAREIASALRLASPAEAGDVLRLLSAGMAGLSTDKLTFRAPNTMWVQSGLPLKQDFTRALTELARATAHQVDFENEPEQARQQINTLIAEQTAGKITDLLAPENIDSFTLLVLANAVYLKAAWAHPFPGKATRDAPFHPEPGREVSVPMMRLTENFGYAKTDRYQAVLLPYDGHELVMAVVLPDGPLRPCEDGLADGGLARIIGAASPHQVRLSLPRFRHEARFDLIPALERLGMRLAFTDWADFSGISDRAMSVDGVIHKAYIGVDERGTEAAAATAVTFTLISAYVPPGPVEMTVDRPFLFAVVHGESGLPLFLGRVTNPLSS